MASYKNSMLLAVASYGIEAVSNIWNVTSSGKIDLIKDVVTVGTCHDASRVFVKFELFPVLFKALRMSCLQNLMTTST